MNTRIAVVSLLLAVSMQGTVLAQQAPITTSSPPAPHATSANTAPAFRATEVGDTTRYLLHMQADGSQAGKPLPTLGDEATASYHRYLKSFEHPIPDFYESISKNSDTVK